MGELCETAEAAADAGVGLLRPANIAAVVAVLVVYLFFATAGSFRFALTQWDGSNYASLAEGFLHGRLSMMQTPDEDLTDVDDPYDPEERDGAPFIWDASLYDGRYYLYFSPVPVVLLYIPFKLIARAYPSDQLAATLFSAIAFLFSAAFIARALRDTKPRVPLWLWTLMTGLGNVVAYVLVNVRMYEVAVTAAMMFTSAWAYSLLRYIESRSTKSAAWIGASLALAIASRPNTAILLVITAIALFRDRRAVIAAAIPLVIVAAIVMTYNAARFGSPFELGTTYQLTATDMHGKHVCSLCTAREAARLVNSASEYVFTPPVFETRFPFVRLDFNHLDPRVSYPGVPERIIGLGPLVPLALVGTLFALLTPGDRGPRLVLAGGWLVLLGLSTCWWIVARYSLDFVELIAIASAVFVERGLAMFPTRTLRVLVIVLACWTIATGVLIGFADMFDTMRHAFPHLFRRVLV